MISSLALSPKPMNLITIFKTLGLLMLDLVFPVKCVVCSNSGQFLCERCKGKLTHLNRQLCPVCNKPAAFGKTHIECTSRNKLDGLISPLSYHDPRVRKIIEMLKYKFISDLATTLSELILEEIKNNELENFFKDFVIIPVPLHPSRLKWRGFNQSELLAQPLSNSLGTSLKLDLVKRVKFSKPQMKLNKEERIVNIKNSFLVTAKIPKQKVLLVDDVATTKSTLHEISKVLKRAGAEEVWALTVAQET